MRYADKVQKLISKANEKPYELTINVDFFRICKHLEKIGFKNLGACKYEKDEGRTCILVEHVGMNNWRSTRFSA